jgi:hypothetical protein
LLVALVACGVVYRRRLLSRKKKDAGSIGKAPAAKALPPPSTTAPKPQTPMPEEKEEEEEEEFDDFESDDGDDEDVLFASRKDEGPHRQVQRVCDLAPDSNCNNSIWGVLVDTPLSLLKFSNPPLPSPGPVVDQEALQRL